MDLFSVAATLTLDTSEFNKNLDDAQRALAGLVSDGAGSSGVNRTKSVLSSIASAASAAVDSVVDLGHEAVDFGWGLIKTSAEIKAQQAAFSDTFQEMAGDARGIFADIAGETNILSRILQEQGTQGFTQFRAAGMDATEALSGMERFLRIAADGAARYDIALDEAAAKVLSFTRGNVAGAREIGLVTSATDRNTVALERYGQKWAQLTSAQRQNVMLDIAQSMYDAANTTGQAARESQQFGVSYNNFLKTWEGARAIMGASLSDKIIPVMDRLTQTMQESPEFFSALGDTLGDLFAVGADVMLDVLQYAVEHKDDIISMVQTVGSILTGNFWDTVSGAPLDPIDQALKYVSLQDVSLDKLGKALGGREAALSFVDKVNTWLDDNPDKTRADISVDLIAEWAASSQAKLQQQASGWRIFAEVIPTVERIAGTIDDYIGTWGHDNAGGYDKGLGYVPYDNFPAWLHRGETVLSRVEAENWRAAQRGDGGGVAPAAIAEAVRAALAGVSISMDGRTVGALVTPFVSAEQAAEAWRRR